MANGHVTFGFESLGNQETGPLQIIIGDGQANKLITRITGQASAALDNPTDNNIHGYLFTAHVLQDPVVGQIYWPHGAPDPQVAAADIGAGILQIHAKLTKGQISLVPFDLVFDPPVLAVAGTINAYMDCRPFVNVEIRFTIQWRDP